VVPREVFQNADARARFVPGPTTDIARVGLGVAVRSGAPRPEINTPDALKQTLLRARSIATIPASAAGAQVLRTFERLGIADEMKAKTKAMPVNTGYVAELVARGEAEMAAQQMPELKAVAGVDPVPLPPELQLVIVFSAGVSAAPGDPSAVNALIGFLSSPAAAPVLKAKGLDPF
jgi:molybdate transport system substrate-binding protein